jgi:hypothetical protein
LKINRIFLYDEPTVPEIQIEKLLKFLTDTFPVKVEIRKNFLKYSNNDIFEKIASARVFDLKKPFQRHVPTLKEIEVEKENKDNSEQEEMFLYDGFKIQEVISEVIPKNEIKLDTLHVFFTNKLTCTYDENDFRYHARALISSNPTIISTSGIVEAPAKPKQFYFELMSDFSNERINEIKKKYKGEFLEYHDPRTSEVIEGYLLQAIMYQETGEIFCDQNDCRLFNAHWQKDLLYTQLENKKFCQKHLEIIKKITN